MKTIALCMIVKNESKVIERCLESVRPLIDYVLIEDTGSTDGTQAIIRKWLERAGLRGEVWDEPWRDFAYNRSHALARLREIKWVDYALIMDADDQLVFEPDFDVAAFKSNLNDILCDVELRRSGTRYWRVQICSNKHEFRYRGVLHEFIEGPPGPLARSTVRGFYIETGREGARSQDPDKYRKDAALLETALKTETDEFLRSRYTFYLARSYRDAGENEKALPHFLKRAELGYWNEEIFISLYNAGQIQEALGRPFEEAIATYLRASDAAPSRAEALHAASRLCRVNDRFADGYEYAQRGLAIPPPSGGLFLEPWPYDYALLDEFAVNAYWTERYQDCLDACERLLREGKMPSDMRERVKKNAEFAREKLAAAAVAKGPSVLRRSSAEQTLKCAVVTPYYQEERAVLERCIRSVHEQTIPSDHIVVADGFPQDWIDRERVRHIRLDRAHSDYGGTPRAVGCLLAISEQYDVVALLDGDNWFEPDHLEHCLEAAGAGDGNCDYVIARSRIVRPDGSAMNVPAESIDAHVDTSCYVFLRGSLHALPIWGLMPKEASALGDRFFLAALRELKLVPAVSKRITVNYTSRWEAHYRALGEAPPPGAKASIGSAQITKWIGSLSDRDRQIAERLMRVNLKRTR